MTPASRPLMGLTMAQPLLLQSLLVHAESQYGPTAIITRRVDDTLHRTTWAGIASRARKLSRALVARGLGPGDRIATLAWNTDRHLEAYYGVTGSQMVLHTVNPRLFPEQLVYIVNHAEDRVMFFDINLAPLIAALAPRTPGIRHWVALCDPAQVPEIPGVKVECYETWLASAGEDPGGWAWPVFDEETAAVMCYTSGTTGNPKGVLYSHRALMLHTMVACLPDTMGITSRDTVLPVVPMFHVNAWNLPFSCALAGAKLVLPGARLDGASLYQLFEDERVTFTAGVPTIWLGLLQYLRAKNARLSTVKRMVVGGSALPEAIYKAFQAEQGIDMTVAWGMTEMSPLGTVNAPNHADEALSGDARTKQALRAGRAPFGVRMRVVDPEGRVAPCDGATTGDLQVQGPWVMRRYYGADTDATTADGWFPTGDVATLSADGMMTITDRAKDVIKSGGEWIPSIELENVAMGHPAVAEAAVIARPHEKWDERPLLVVVKKPGMEVTDAELLAFYDGKVAKWWIPDGVFFTDDIPHTATGKISKLDLRKRLDAMKTA